MTSLALAICIVVAILCWTWLRTKGQVLEHAAEAKRLDAHNAQLGLEADLMRDMAAKGYVQVPVIKELVSEANSVEDEEDWEDDAETFSERRSWQLAWVPKEQMETMLAAAINPDAGDPDLLEAALRPT